MKDSVNPKFLFKISLTVFFSIVFLYLTVLPNINTGYGDSDELITAAKVWGVPHPPAYPLYTVLAGLFARIPWPILNFAGRVNFINTIYQAAAATLFFLVTFFLSQKISQNKAINFGISLLTATSLILSPSFMLYGIITEVFSLNNFLILLTIFCLCLWERRYKKIGESSQKYLLLAALAFGLSLSNQQVSVLLFPSYAVFVLSTYKRAIFDGKLIIFTFLIAALGFLGPYIYLPLAAKNSPVINWENPQTLNGIYRSITRRVYAEVSPIGHSYIETRIDLKKTPDDLVRFFSFLISEFTLPLFILGIIGIIFLLYKKQFKVAAFLFLGVVGGGMFFSIYAPFQSTKDFIYFNTETGIYQRFFLVSSIFWAFLIAFGALGIYFFIKDFLLPTFNKNPQKFEKITSQLLVTSVLLLVPLIFQFPNYLEIKKNNFNSAHQFGDAFLDSLEKNAILLCYSEHTCFTGLYMQYVEGKRPDVIILQVGFVELTLEEFKKKYPDLVKTSTPRASTSFATLIVRDLLRWQIDKRPLYVAGINNDPTFLSAHGLDGDPFFLIPNGCVLKIAKNFSVLPQSIKCQKLTSDYLNSYFSPKLPISDMFRSYLAYQHFIQAIQYLSFSCPKLGKDELFQMAKLTPGFVPALDALAYITKQDNQNYCQDLTAGPNLAETLQNSLGSEKKNDFDHALYYQVEAASLSPSDVNIRLRLADLYTKQGAYNNAVLEYTDVLNLLDPKNQTAENGLKYLETVFETP